jgi:B12-binding domain/radical SAM domain protein
VKRGPSIIMADKLIINNNIVIIFYYTKSNRYSFNALVGSLEANNFYRNIPIFFINNEDNLKIELNNIINNYEFVIVGFSFFTTQIWEINSLISELKNLYEKPVYVAGGPHPTGDPLGTLKMGFDIVVRGEGEETFIDLLNNIRSNENYSTIKGIAFIKDNGEYQFTGWRNPIDLNNYPPFGVKHKKFGAIEITRGCPYVCYFCQTPYIFRSNLRHRSIDSIIKYVEIMRNHNLKDIRFITPNAFSYGSSDGKSLNINKLEELLVSIRKVIGSEGKIFIGSFPSEVRPEHVNEETLNLILKYANNDNIIIGAQSGSQRILDACHRSHKVEDIYKAVEYTRKAGLKANVDFIFGLPKENEEDIKLTIKVIKDLLRKGARIHAHTFMPLPQTPFAKAPPGKIGKRTRKLIEELEHKGLIYGDWIEQENKAKMISRYLRTGNLEG